MSKGHLLGELEQIVLLAVHRLGSDAYGLNIRREIEARSGRDVAIGAVYSALDRMEQKGLVSSQFAAPVAQRGGRSRRCFTMEPSGRDALQRSILTLHSLLDGAPLEPGPARR